LFQTFGQGNFGEYQLVDLEQDEGALLSSEAASGGVSVTFCDIPV
jgi:hypothetical protein